VSAEIFPGGQRRYLAYTFRVAEDAIQMDFHTTLYPFYQACSQVLNFGVKNAFLGGQDFCFYYMFKKILLGTTQFGKEQKYLGWQCPRTLPGATGLLSTPKNPLCYGYSHKNALLWQE